MARAKPNSVAMKTPPGIIYTQFRIQSILRASLINKRWCARTQALQGDTLVVIGIGTGTLERLVPVLGAKAFEVPILLEIEDSRKHTLVFIVHDLVNPKALLNNIRIARSQENTARPEMIKKKKTKANPARWLYMRAYLLLISSCR